MEEMNLKPLEQSRDMVLSQVQQIVVKDTETEIQAAGLLAIVRTKLKEIETERKSWTDPIEQHKKRIIAEFKRITAPLEEAEVKLGAALSLYRMKIEKERQEREAKLQAKEDKKFERQIESGKTPLVPEPLQVHIEAQPKTIALNGKKMTYAESWKADYEHVKIEDVPKTFNGVQILVVDRLAVNKLIGAGIREIPGIPITKEVGTRIR